MYRVHCLTLLPKSFWIYSFSLFALTPLRSILYCLTASWDSAKENLEERGSGGRLYERLARMGPKEVGESLRKETCDQVQVEVGVGGKTCRAGIRPVCTSVAK